MTKHDCKSGDALQPSKYPRELHQQLKQLDESLYQLLCAGRFYRSAVEAVIYQADKEQTINMDTDWQFGLFLVGQWLEESGHGIMQKVGEIRSKIQT